MSLRARWSGIGLATVGLVTALVASPHQPVGYVVRAALHEATLLWGRVPLEQGVANLSSGRRARAELVPRVKAFAETELGLVGRGTYDTVHPTWDAPAWNVSGCRPLAFEARRYWFPLVGSIPYLGFFDEPTARAHAARLEAEGYETWVRPVGTWSTLGWFDDPLLPGMFDWTEQHLADTLIHEIVHANVWVRGSVAFNESLASFVGEEGALAWIAHEHGVGSPEHDAAVDGVRADHEREDRAQRAVAELEALYADLSLSDDQKRVRKAAVLSTLPDPETWNNARLLQFRTYHRGLPAFRALYTAEGRDVRRFLDRVRAIVESGGDPWTALARTSGVP